MFTARYGLMPYIKQVVFLLPKFKQRDGCAQVLLTLGLMVINGEKHETES